jgi:4'-phosphopantetheinyl transferase
VTAPAETSLAVDERAPSERLAPAWRPGPTDPTLLDSTVDVWRAELTSVDPELVALLSREDRRRATQIAHERTRELWQRSRGLLRALLARYLRVDAETPQITVGTYGKPELPRVALHFNLSHSRELALYAFTRVGPVGVDVELEREREASARGARDHVALARRALGDRPARQLALMQRPQREREFLRLWTRYEAECKRRGTGIMSGSAVAGEPSWLAELDVGPRSAAAVACSLEPGELRCWDWSE